MKNRTRSFTAVAAWVGLFFAVATTATAHDPSETLSDRGYQQMQRLAHDLEGQAQHANDQAQHEGNRFYSNDRTFQRSLANFTRRAGNFHERMDTYQTAPWQMDDELRALLRDARVVQYRVQRSRYNDPHTLGDWNRTVEILNQMIRLYQTDTSGGSYGSSPDPRGYGQPAYPRDSRPADRYEVHGANEARGAYDAQQFGTLAHELAQRSTRLTEAVTQLSGRYRDDAGQSESVRSIQHFAEQANAFHERYEAGMNPEDLRGNVSHLWDDGREADQQFRRSNVPELQREWSAMMQLLARIRSAAGL